MFKIQHSKILKIVNHQTDDWQLCVDDLIKVAKIIRATDIQTQPELL